MATEMGFFGKLPGYGDFVERNLPRSFLDQWDPWLQRGISGSQQSLGEQWLNNYLTAPVWQFALSPGCVDSNAWLGLFLPSVDKVGRYFPLTLAMPVNQSVNLSAAVYHNAPWFEKLAAIGVACLKESPTVEAVADVLQNLEDPLLVPWRVQRPESTPLGNCVSSASGDMKPEQGDVSLLQSLTLSEGLLRQHYPSYSLWYTAGGEHSPNALLSAESLPNPQGFAAMLGGQWQQFGWNIL